MTFKSKRKIMAIIIGLMVWVFYIVFALSAQAPAVDDVSAWAIVILKFIGITVGVAIISQILFHVAYAIGVAAKERDQDDKQVERIISSTVVEDEMDKAVELKSSAVGYVCMGVGFVIMLFALATRLPFVWALHIQLGAIMLASVIEGIVSIYLYERGI